MNPAIEMCPGTLKGMGREVECFVEVLGNYSQDSRPMIQNVPPDMPEGEYVFTYKKGSIPFKKYQGMLVPDSDHLKMIGRSRSRF